MLTDSWTDPPCRGQDLDRHVCRCSLADVVSDKRTAGGIHTFSASSAIHCKPTLAGQTTRVPARWCEPGVEAFEVIFKRRRRLLLRIRAIVVIVFPRPCMASRFVSSYAAVCFSMPSAAGHHARQARSKMRHCINHQAPRTPLQSIADSQQPLTPSAMGLTAALNRCC